MQGSNDSVAGAHHRLLRDGRIELGELAQLAARPARFAPHEGPFWDDPHIAGQMLAAHLDPTTDLASRRPETIDRSVEWLMAHLALRRGHHLLDLGCGPGLYCQRFARRGVHVTGVDLSRSSLEFARRMAADEGLAIEYLEADYVTLDLVETFDAAVMIYLDFCVLPDDRRDKLLERVRRALRPGGVFAFDVTTPRRAPADCTTRWAVKPAGFWRPNPYLELTRTFVYRERMTDVHQTVIVEADGQATVYRVWNQAYTAESITAVLAAQAFEVRGIWSDLEGTLYTPASETLGVVAARAEAG